MIDNKLEILIKLLYQINKFKNIKLQDNYKLYSQKIMTIKDFLEKIKDNKYIHKNYNNLYILINETFDSIPEQNNLYKIVNNYDSNIENKIPLSSNRDNYLNFINILNCNFNHLSLYINEYIDKVCINFPSCEIQINSKNSNIIELITINNFINEKFKNFINDINQTKYNILMEDMNLIINISSKIYENINYDKMSKNEINNFNLDKYENIKLSDLKITLYKNILIKCKTIINSLSHIISDKHLK